MSKPRVEVVVDCITCPFNNGEGYCRISRTRAKRRFDARTADWTYEGAGRDPYIPPDNCPLRESAITVQLSKSASEP